MEYYSTLKRNEPQKNLGAYYYEGGNLGAYYYEKEVSLKTLYITGFQLYDILQKAKLWR